MLLVSAQLHSWPNHFHLTIEACWALPTLFFIDYEMNHSKVRISGWRVTRPPWARCSVWLKRNVPGIHVRDGLSTKLQVLPLGGGCLHLPEAPIRKAIVTWGSKEVTRVGGPKTYQHFCICSSSGSGKHPLDFINIYSVIMWTLEVKATTMLYWIGPMGPTHKVY